MNCYEFAKRYGLNVDLEIAGENSDIRVAGFYKVTISANPDLPRSLLQCGRADPIIFDTNFLLDGAQCQNRGNFGANVAIAEQQFSVEYLDTGEQFPLVITGNPPPVPDPVPPDWIPYGDSYLPLDWPREYKGVPTQIIPLAKDPFSWMRRRNILASQYNSILQLWGGTIFYGNIIITKESNIDNYAVSVIIGSQIDDAGTYICELVQ